MNNKKLMLAISFVLTFGIVGVTNGLVVKGEPLSGNVDVGLVAWYKFDGDAKDSSVNGNDGTVQGATLTADRNGKANGAFHFDGSTFIEVPATESLNGITSAATISAWVKPEDWYPGGGVTLSNPFVSILCKGMETRHYSIQIGKNGLWLFGDYAAGGYLQIGNTISLSAWQHVVMTWDGAAICAYVNGIKVGERAFAGPMKTNADPLYIGKDVGGVGDYGETWGQIECLKGDLDDVRIYNRALSDSEVTALYEYADDSTKKGNLVYYTTFDSVAAVEKPVVGSAGTCYNASFRAGKKGQAIYVPAGQSAARMPFPKGIPVEKGCIEFWAKIEATSATFGSGANPRFYLFVPAGSTVKDTRSTLELNANNGWGGSGWNLCHSGAMWETSGHTSDYCNTYSKAFGSLDPTAWHHYQIRWNTNGLAGASAKVMAFTIDDQPIVHTTKSDFDACLAKGDPFYGYYNGEPLDLSFSQPVANVDNNKVPFLMDEFKVWDSDEIGVTPDQDVDDGVDVVNGVTWYYTLKDGEATIVKGAIPYAGDLTTPTKLDGHPVKAIDGYAFGECAGLTSLVVSDGVETIGSGAFARNPNLRKAVLPDSATNIVESCFYECSSLTEFRLPKWLPKMSPFFFKGTSVTEVVIPEGVTSFGHDVFYDATNLVSVTLPETLTFLDWSAFQNACSLKSIEFPAGFSGFGVWSYRDELHAVFGKCSSLATAIFHGRLPTNFVYSWLLQLNCKIYYPREFATEWSAAVPAEKFGGYTEDIGGGGDNPSGGDDPDLNDGVDVVDGVTWYYTLKDGEATIVAGKISYSGDLVVPEVLDGHPVVAIGQAVFHDNASVSSIYVPDSVKRIEGWAFDHTAGLVSVRLPATLELLGDSAFSSASALTNGVLPSGFVRIEKDVFHTNKKLASMVVPEGVKSMGRAVFYDCESLKEVWFPESFESFDHDSNMEMHMQFGRCTALEAVYFLGHVPANLMTSGLQLYGKIYFSKKYASEWEQVVTLAKFGGYIEDLAGGDEPGVDPTPDDPAPSEEPALVFPSMENGTTIQVECRQGVELALPVEFADLDNPKVRVTGLPAGLVFRNGEVTGSPRTASSKRNGAWVAKSARFTVTLPDGKVVKLYAEFTVLPRATWSVGDFDGTISLDGGVAGPATFRLGANGRGFGYFTTVVEGRRQRVVMKSTELAAYDPELETAEFAVTLRGGGYDGRVVKFSLAADTGSVGRISTTEADFSMTLVQNAWKAKHPAAPVFKSGANACTLELDNGLVLKFLPKGVVTATGKIVGDDDKQIAVKVRSQLLPLEYPEDGANAEVVLFVAPRKGLAQGLVAVPRLNLEADDNGMVTRASLVIVR